MLNDVIMIDLGYIFVGGWGQYLACVENYYTPNNLLV